MEREHNNDCCCCREHLTERETQVARLVTLGYTNDAVAKSLQVSVHTVVRHMTAMLRKTGERNRAGLVTRLFRDGILVMGPDGAEPSIRRCLKAPLQGTRPIELTPSHADG